LQKAIQDNKSLRLGIMVQEKSSNKIKEISDILYKETILPAKEEAERIIAEAKKSAAGIIHKAQDEALAIAEKNKAEMGEERRVHESSIDLAIKQAVATLKAEIMTIFNSELSSSLKETLSGQQACQDLLQVIIKGIKDEGISSDLKLFVSKNVDFENLSNSVTSLVTKKLEKGDVTISSGIAVSIQNKKLTLKITDETCGHLLADKLPEILRAKVFA
jgi:V/A-type H+/Na+-transporting ATPase subunit E